MTRCLSLLLRGDWVACRIAAAATNGFVYVVSGGVLTCVVLGVLSLFILLYRAVIVAVITGIGRPRVDAGLLTGSPDVVRRPSDSRRIATAVAWSSAIPNRDMN